MTASTVETQNKEIAAMVGIVANRYRDNHGMVAIADSVMSRLSQVNVLRGHMSTPLEGQLYKPNIHGQDLAETLALGSAMVELHTARDILRVALQRYGEKV